jgi:hypothetical protein
MLPFSVRDITVNKQFLRTFINFDMNSETAYSQACIHVCMVRNATLTKDDIQYNPDTTFTTVALPQSSVLNNKVFKDFSTNFLCIFGKI